MPVEPNERYADADGFFIMGKAEWDAEPYVPAQQPTTGKMDIFVTALHEVAHTLGIGSLSSSEQSINDKYKFYLGLKYKDDQTGEINYLMNRYTEHLYDDNHQVVQAGQVVICRGCDYSPEEVSTGFDVRKDQGYFKGLHVVQVLQGAMPGVPVKMGDYDNPDSGRVDPSVMSHLEMKNGLMSHQHYSNYTTFMEAELAVLQDLGYEIDRRNFFGSSVYGDGLKMTNHQPYYQRNAAGTAYLPNQYNHCTLGVGLHVYGRYNHITQVADLLTQGVGAAGIRVDGEGNTIHIPAGTKIHANGLNGRGVMFAYGKDHELIHQGEIQALGERGVGLSFDFGINSLGNETQYRGSWLRRGKNDTPAPLLSELKGPLAKRVDIGGKIAGRDASIYISSNALVETINILSGAELQGDIYSHYHQRDEDNHLREGRINFGLKADALGLATTQADPNFRFNYQGNIYGINNLSLATRGGVTSLNGEYRVLSMLVDKDSTLMGNGRYTLNPEHSSLFYNLGTVSPGNSFGHIRINGNFTQSPTGRLLMELDGRGNYDQLTVSGFTHLDGRLSISPQADWYGEDWRLKTSQMLRFNKPATGNLVIETASDFSPTLSLKSTTIAPLTWQLSMHRAVNAYSQYAVDGNSRAVAQVLDRIAGKAPQVMQGLVKGLDFSAPSGAGIRQALPQLTPSSYSMLISQGLAYEQKYSDVLLSSYFADAATQEVRQGKRLFIMPMAGDARLKQRHGHIEHEAKSYGVLFGGETYLRNPAWTLGVHVALGHLDLKSKDWVADGDSQVYGIGVHARYTPSTQQGIWFKGLARLSYVDDKLKRHINFGDYQAKHHASRSGWNGILAGRLGYRFALNQAFGLSPVLALDYAHIRRGKGTENGSDATRLRLNDISLNSLRAGMGVEVDWSKALSDKQFISAKLALSWRHELLNKDIKQKAHFVAAPSQTFFNHQQLPNRSALNLQAGLNYQLSERFELGAYVANDWYRGGGHNLSGNLKASWRFK